ncbi:hypothetical protein ACRALDRAFT_210086 [Sodiomyces alcalophilus JCM 7366]|uniref:uncharacterized protein n=1 Tax=Sodiomyces alcalophilus JCM 7366 TaxID=591952 RepID=UPI0039B6A1E6
MTGEGLWKRPGRISRYVGTRRRGPKEDSVSSLMSRGPSLRKSDPDNTSEEQRLPAFPRIRFDGPDRNIRGRHHDGDVVEGGGYNTGTVSLLEVVAQIRLHGRVPFGRPPSAYVPEEDEEPRWLCVDVFWVDSPLGPRDF